MFRRYRLWNLKDYSIIYQFFDYELINISNKIINDAKLTPNGLLLISPKKKKSIIVTIKSLNENKIITKINIDISDFEKNDKEIVKFIEYHNGFLYVKYYEKSPLKIYDVKLFYIFVYIYNLYIIYVYIFIVS